MPFHYPFRVFANANLGTQFDYTDCTGELLNAHGTGHSAVLPEINPSTGNVILKSNLIKTQESTGNFELGYVYNAQNPTPWNWNIPGVISSNASQVIFRERDGSVVTYLWDATQNTYVSPSGAPSKFLITRNTDGSFLQIDPKTGDQNNFDAFGKITS